MKFALIAAASLALAATGTWARSSAHFRISWVVR